MPIYDYHCDHCGHTFSAVQSYTDATLETCPSCGKRPRKLMATPAIVFRGGGWYKTDSRPAQKDGDSKAGPTDGGEKSGEKADKPPAKSDDKTKPAPPAKSDTKKSDAPAPGPKGEAASS
ncbi:MAG: FmdB family transcriptional regulator [Chloroflexota bacterium]|nr:FmdB family transcriptional regulator [Chloroflexota bacterium]